MWLEDFFFFSFCLTPRQRFFFSFVAQVALLTKGDAFDSALLTDDVVTDALIEKLWDRLVRRGGPLGCSSFADLPFCDAMLKRVCGAQVYHAPFAKLGFAALNEALRALLRIEPLLLQLENDTRVKFDRLIGAAAAVAAATSASTAAVGHCFDRGPADGSVM